MAGVMTMLLLVVALLVALLMLVLFDFLLSHDQLLEMAKTESFHRKNGNVQKVWFFTISFIGIDNLLEIHSICISLLFRFNRKLYLMFWVIFFRAGIWCFGCMRWCCVGSGAWQWHVCNAFAFGLL